MEEVVFQKSLIDTNPNPLTNEEEEEERPNLPKSMDGDGTCPFYTYIGACRRGYRCSLVHNKPDLSRMLLLRNIYQRPDSIDVHGNPINRRNLLQHFADFYEELATELNKYGEVVNLNICDNLADHLAGNAYVRYLDIGQAANALRNLQGRFFEGRLISADFSPVDDFDEAICQLYESKCCNHGKRCSFMHIRNITSEKEELEISSMSGEGDNDSCSDGYMKTTELISGLMVA